MISATSHQPPATSHQPPATSHQPPATSHRHARMRRNLNNHFTASVSSLDPALLELVDRYWARFFGCAPQALRSDTAQMGVHIGQGDYAGCYLMEFGGAPIVSLPIGEIEPHRAAIAQWQAGTVRTPALVEAVFGKRVVASIGPAFVGYSDLKHFRPSFSSSTRRLTARDEKAVDLLRAACSVDEWEHGGSEARRLGFVQYATSLAVRFAFAE